MPYQKKLPQHRKEDSTVLHIAKTPPTENVINFPCAGNGKFPIFSAQERMNGEKYSFTHAWQPLAATCSLFSSHRQPLAPTCGQSSGRQWPPAFSSHRQPLAPTCGQSSGRQWPPAFSSHRQPLAATCSQSSGCQWPPVAARASGRKWPQVAARASGRKWPQVAARASGRKWPQVAASGRKWPPLPESNSFPSARSLKFWFSYQNKLFFTGSETFILRRQDRFTINFGVS